MEQYPMHKITIFDLDPSQSLALVKLNSNSRNGVGRERDTGVERERVENFGGEYSLVYCNCCPRTHMPLTSSFIVVSRKLVGVGVKSE